MIFGFGNSRDKDIKSALKVDGFAKETRAIIEETGSNHLTAKKPV